MEEQIQQAIRDVKAGLYTRIQAQQLFLDLTNDAMTCTQHLIDSGNVNLRKIYLDMLDELNHYARQLPKIGIADEQLRPENPQFIGESIKNTEK